MATQEKEFTAVCRVCQETSKFRMVVYVEEKLPHFDLHDRIGPGSGRGVAPYPQRHNLPLAYCTICKTVIFVGPDPQELEREINKKGTAAAEAPMEIPDYTATSREADKFLRAIRPVGKSEKAGAA